MVEEPESSGGYLGTKGLSKVLRSEAVDGRRAAESHKKCGVLLEASGGVVSL